MSDFAFFVGQTGPLSDEEAVYQALGAASVCWEDPGGAGIFQSERAGQIGQALLAHFAGPRLGYATTGELLAELSARIETGARGLDYTTVHGEKLLEEPK